MLGEHLGVNLKLKKDKDDDADYKNSAREACECASEKDCQWDCGEDEVAVKEDWHEGDGDESGDKDWSKEPGESEDIVFGEILFYYTVDEV